MIIEEDGKVEVDKGVGSAGRKKSREFERLGFKRRSTLKTGGQTHWSMVAACSYALVAFSTSSKLVRATVEK